MSTTRGLDATTLARAAAPVRFLLAATAILTVIAWHAGIAVPLFAVLLCP